jgi:hypothetical protein
VLVTHGASVLGSSRCQCADLLCLWSHPHHSNATQIVEAQRRLLCWNGILLAWTRTRDGSFTEMPT